MVFSSYVRKFYKFKPVGFWVIGVRLGVKPLNYKYDKITMTVPL